MGLTFKDLVRFIVDGDPVNQGTINSVLRDLDNNTRYLKELFDAATLGSTVFARKVTIEIDAVVGMVVYYNVTTSRFERAKSAATTDSNGEAVTADSAHVWGVVYTKHTATSADLLLTGYAKLDISAAVTGTVTAGMYYLSSGDAGKMVQVKPPVTVGVLQADSSGNVYVNPSFSDVLVDHTHHKTTVVAVPSGDHVPPLSTGTHTITEPSTGWDTSTEGWLPASHAVFNTRPAPAGALFGYNIDSNATLVGLWPPTPLDNAYIEWDRGGVTYSGAGSAGITVGDKSVIKLDDNGIWWMTDCYDTVPWPTNYNTSGGRIYWSNNVSDKIVRSNYDGSSKEDLLTGLGDPEGIAIDGAERKVYWIDRSSDTIKRTNLDGTGTAESLVTGLTSAYGLILDTSDASASNHKLYWVDATGQFIKRATKEGASVTTLFDNGTDGISSPQDLALDAAANTLWWTDDGTNKIQKGATDGTGTSATATVTITDFTQLNSADKVNLIATDTTNYDFVNGSQSSVAGTWESATSNDQTATNLMNVINTSSGPSGTRFSATVDGAVVTITQATVGLAGNTTVTLTDSGTAGMTSTSFVGGSDPGGVTDVITSLTTPKGIVLDVAASKVYWCDEGASKIQRANFDGTGTEDLINAADGLSTPRGLDIDLVANKIYWTDATTKKLQRAGKDIPGSETVGSRTDIVDVLTSLNTANFPILLAEDNTVTGVSDCPVELPMSLGIWFTKLTFQTTNTVVTSLRAATGSKISITCLQNSTETEVTGDLVIDVDFALLVDATDSNGYTVTKEFNSSTQTFAKGLVVEAIRSSSSDIIISSDHSATPSYIQSGVSNANQGVVTIGLIKSVLGNEIPIELVRLNGVTEENYQDVLGLGFPKGKDTEYRGQFKIPQSLGAAAPISVKLRFWFLAFADAQDLPLTGTNPMTFSYRVIESLTAANPIKALATSDSTDVDFPGVVPSSYAVAKGSYIEIETGEITIQNSVAGDTSNGQTVLFTLARKGSVDGYDGEIHVINQRAVIV